MSTPGMSTPGILPSQMRTALRIGSAATVAFAALIGVWASVGPAASQDGACNSRDDVHQALEQGFGETPVAMGIVSEDVIVELFAAAEGATWTLMVSNADGQACVLAAGTDWQSHSPAAPPNLNARSR
jgi:hypothetical protein